MSRPVESYLQEILGLLQFQNTIQRARIEELEEKVIALQTLGEQK